MHDGHRAAGERGFADAVEVVVGRNFNVDELLDGKDVDGSDFHAKLLC